MAVVSWTIEKEKLSEALNILALVPSQPGLPSSEFFQITGKASKTEWTIASMATGVVKMNGTGTWPFEKPLYLDRRLFVPFIAAEVKSKDQFEFSRQGKRRLIIKHGKRRKAKFDGQSKVAGYGFPPQGKLLGKLELTDHSRNLIYCARECATNDPVTPQLNCVYVRPNGKKINIYATNQKIVYYGHSRTRLNSAIAIPFPLFLVTLLGQANLKEIHWKERVMTLIFPQGEVWQTISSRAAKGFPAKAIDKNMQHVEDFDLAFTVECKRFGHILERLASYLSAVRRQDWMLELTGEKGSKGIYLTCSVPTGRFHEIISAKEEHPQNFRMEWPFEMLLPVFEYIKKDKGLMHVRHKKGNTYVTATDIKLAIPVRET